AAPTIHVDVVSAEESIFSGEAEFVVLPGEAGELGIYPRHTPLITRIKPGAVRITPAGGGEEHLIFVAGGILEVQPKVITVPADHAVSRFARERRAGNMPGAESHGCAVCAGQHVALDAEARHSQPGDGPGIGPRPGLCLALAAQGPCPGVRDETLRQPCLGLNPCSTPQLPRA